MSLKSISVNTSVGQINLTSDEHLVLEKLLSGTATMSEGQGLYQLINARGLPFPMEWEVLVLQATLKELPDREDLLQRLKLIQPQVFSYSAAAVDQNDEIEWKRAWARFSTSKLIGYEDAKKQAAAHGWCFADACTLLSNIHFETLTVSQQVATILALHDTFMSSPSPDLISIADLAIRHFRRMLEETSLEKSQAMAVYDALHSMYFAGTNDVLNLRRFDAIVPTFESFLKRKDSTKFKPSVINYKNRVLNIAYLLHTGHFDRGNAVSPLIVSLAEMHAAYPNRCIFLYLVQYIGPNFLQEIEDCHYTVRQFAQGRDYGRLEEIKDALRKDNIDVIITEQNRAIASALFVGRAAPLQIWADTGFAYWSLKSLDWTISPIRTEIADKVRKRSQLTWRQTSDTLIQEFSPSALVAAKGQFPINSFVIGVFVRLIKLNDDFFDLIEELLSIEPSIWLVIAGTGDPSSVHSYIKKSKNANRIVFLHENVNLNIYGKVVDVMCDTFPFIGGNACREIGAHGTPVVSMLGNAWDDFLFADRSPDLLAHDRQEYINIVLKLCHDQTFRNQQRGFAFELYARQTDPISMIDDVEAGITSAAAAMNGISFS